MCVTYRPPSYVEVEVPLGTVDKYHGIHVCRIPVHAPRRTRSSRSTYASPSDIITEVPRVLRGVEIFRILLWREVGSLDSSNASFLFIARASLDTRAILFHR